MKKPKPNGGAGRLIAELPGVDVPVALDPTPAPGGLKRKLSTAEVQRLTGLSQQRISLRKRRGETGEEIVQAVQQRKAAEQAALAADQEHRARTSGTAPAPLSYSVRRKAEADANLRELEEATRRGELAPVAPMFLYLDGSILAARQLLETLPRELAAELAIVSDPIQVEQVLDAAIERALEAAAKNSQRLCRAIFHKPIDLALPPKVQQAIRTIGEYSASLFRGDAASARGTNGGGNE